MTRLAPPLIDCWWKSPALYWPLPGLEQAGLWRKEPRPTFTRAAPHGPDRRRVSTQMLASDWSAADIPGLWLVRTLTWPRVTLVHGWDAGTLIWDYRAMKCLKLDQKWHIIHLALWAGDTGMCSCVLSVYNWRKNAAQFQFKLKRPYNVTTGVWTFRNPSHIQNMQCIDKFSTYNIMSCVQGILGNDRHDLCPYWHSPWLCGW